MQNHILDGFTQMKGAAFAEEEKSVSRLVFRIMFISTSDCRSLTLRQNEGDSNSNKTVAMTEEI